jgi:hypothetical protein
MRQAEDMWRERALLRNDFHNTAAAIADAVNAEIRAKGLLPRNKPKLSSKTIAGWIAKEIRG